MQWFSKGAVNPVVIPVVSAPHFLLGSLLAAYNWQRLGQPGKARTTVIWSVVGAVAVVLIAINIPPETLKKMWSIGVGINLGTGMALRTLQLPDFNRAEAKGRARTETKGRKNKAPQTRRNP